MDIGTAKPTAEERAKVRHWGLDLVDPGEQFTVSDFKSYADKKIKEIRSRGRVPFLVGGSGLYCDAVIFDYSFGAKADPNFRAMLEAMSLAELHKYCLNNNIILPENSKNKRYVIRAIERVKTPISKKHAPDENTIIVGITTSKEVLKQRIRERAQDMFNADVVDEATRLAKTFGWDNEAMTGNIYPLIRSYLSGEITLEEAKEKFITLDWRLAKRQLTWFKRNPFIQWLELSQAKAHLLRVLARE